MKRLVLRYRMKGGVVENYEGYILKLNGRMKILLVKDYSFKAWELVPENVLFHFHINGIDFFEFLDSISKNPVEMENVIKFIAFNIDRRYFKESIENIVKSLTIFDKFFLDRFFKASMRGIRIASANLIDEIRFWCAKNNVDFLKFMKKEFGFEELKLNNYIKGILKKFKKEL